MFSQSNMDDQELQKIVW